MFLLDGTVVTSPSDLSLASRCEFAFALQLDAKLGKIRLEKVERDPIEQRAADLGDVHENRHLALYREQYGGGVVELPRPSITREGLRAAADATAEALRSGASVVFQATFFDEGPTPLIGFADFLVRQPDGRYRVQDTKLARSVKVPALLQLAAYHEQIARLGIPVDDTVELILGTDEHSAHHIDDIAPVYAARRARLVEIARERIADPDYVRWGDERYAIDGRCEICEPLSAESRDVLLTAGLRLTQRAKLRTAGIETIEQLAAAHDNESGIPQRTFEALRNQAALQLGATEGEPPPFVVFDTRPIADLPEPNPGDIFFDFEGDPLYSENSVWGLDYLFGYVDRDERFTAIWAHDVAEEKLALETFLTQLVARRRQYPGMHVYHYASYERTHLLSLAARHGVGEHIVDDLLREGVLVDLYPVVKKTVRVGGRSYSIKKLEPLYMGDELRDGVTNAADSIVEYNRAQELMLEDPGAAAQILDDIADYNRYDCVSTLRLHAWLLGLGEERGILPGQASEVLDRAPFEPSPLADSLAERATSARHDGDLTGATAYDLTAAAVDYYRREEKSFWWAHFARLEYPVDEWENDRDVFIVQRAEVVSDWRLEGPRSTSPRRTLSLTGTWSPGSRGSGREAFTIYDTPTPYTDPRTPDGYRLTVGASDLVTEDDGTVTLVERCPAGEDTWQSFPVAIAPGPPPRTNNLKTAIEEVASRLSVNGPDGSAAADILWRQPALEAPHSGRAEDVAQSILEASYLAVQGPPGTGKTHLAASVIKDLVEKHGWRIGVVAQSHKVVENVLRKLVSPEIGLDPSLVGKAPGEGSDYSDEYFTTIAKDQQLSFAASRKGYVIGGSSWDFTNTKRIQRGQLDLLVIDEAGQFSLAATIAVSVAAKRLLLLGDPQQLPQVSQGTHPAPVDQSALGFIAGDNAVLPQEFGFFLEESRRMDAAVAGPISQLAYDGELRSHPVAATRHLADIEPGVHPVPIAHEGNATQSPEEAARVVILVAEHLGREWTDGDAPTRPLGESDIIVVTPYNAQVDTIRAALDDALYPDVRVGTVDKFQGQEAVVSIVSLAASSAEDVPRGVDFVINRNRLNVAISRAQWAAYLLYSPGLARYLPLKPEGVAELSRFLRLVAGADPIP